MKNLVIIGGGFAGAKISRNLENTFKVTLIDTKDYFEFTPGILRTIIFPKHMDKIQVYHKDYLKKTEFIKGHVMDINEKFVYLKNKKIPYNYLAIASGSSYAMPFKEADIVKTTRAHDLKLAHDQLVRAKDIIIIGGGAVAVEIAAEIATKYKDKEITILHSHEKLMERNNKKTSKYAEKFLKKYNIQLLFNERAKKINNNVIETKSGKRIKSDMIFQCIGIKPNTDFIKNNFKKDLNKKNAIKVNSFLQMNNYKNIFAAGDVNDIKEEKTAQAAEKQAYIVICNIKYLEKKEKLTLYIAKEKPMIISLGKYDAIFEYNNFVITGLIPAFLKYLVERKTMIRYK